MTAKLKKKSKNCIVARRTGRCLFGCSRMERVMRELDAVMTDSDLRRDPIEEQLRKCPEAFKAGELVGKMVDQLKYGREQKWGWPSFSQWRGGKRPLGLQSDSLIRELEVNGWSNPHQAINTLCEMNISFGSPYEHEIYVSIPVYALVENVDISTVDNSLHISYVQHNALDGLKVNACLKEKDRNGIEIVQARAARPDALIEKAQLLRPALILTDLSMPVMNGMDEMRILRKLMPAVPVILYSAHIDPFVQKEALAAGASAVVSKYEAVATMLGKARELLDEIAA